MKRVLALLLCFLIVGYQAAYADLNPSPYCYKCLPVTKTYKPPPADAVKITYDVPSAADHYQLKFEDHTGTYLGDVINQKPLPSTYYLTCNGTYQVKFYNSSNTLVSDTEAINVSEIQNPGCSSYTGGGGTVPPPDTGGTSGSCACCEDIKGALGGISSAIDSQGLKLDNLSSAVGGVKSAIQDQGYKLDSIDGSLRSIRGSVQDFSDKLDTTNSRLGSINSKLGDVNDRIDGTNSRLDGANNRLDAVKGRLDDVNNNLAGIKDSLTPSGLYQIPTRDWQKISDSQSVPYLNSISPISDTNIYFSDPGQADSVPAMPVQPAENYPVPIGENFDRESPLTKQPSISRQLPGTSTPSLQKEPAGVQSPVGQRDPVGSLPSMQRDSVRQRDPVGSLPSMQRDAVRQRDPVPSKTVVPERGN